MGKYIFLKQINIIMIGLFVFLALGIYATKARELLVDHSLNSSSSIPKDVTAFRFLKDSIAPLIKAYSMQLSFGFEDCDDIRFSEIKEESSYLFVHQSLCGNIRGMYVDFADENNFFEFLLQLQKLVRSE